MTISPLQFGGLSVPLARIGLALVLCSSLQLVATAQDTPKAPAATNDSPAAQQSPPPAAAPRAVEASELETFWLRDSKGNLVPVLGMTFEEFEQLLRLKKGLASLQGPAFTLDALSLVGTADDEAANLQVTATIRARQKGWIRVPLEMAAAVLRQPPKYEGPSEHAVVYDAKSGGIVWWINASDEQPHVVTLQLAVKVTTAGDETRLRLTLPRATESALRLSLPEHSGSASLLSGEGIVSATGAGMASVNVLGPAGDLELVWRKGSAAVTEQSSQLEATGNILVRIESEQRISSDARLRVRSFGGVLESFRVRLAPGMELVPAAAPGYAIAPVASGRATEQAGNSASGQLVEVKLDKPATSGVEVRLMAALAADLPPGGEILPAQFEVLDAVRQRGTIDFVTEGEWQLSWQEDATVRRVDPTTDAGSLRPVARFDYFRQPCGLKLQVAARPSRVSVEPAHVVHIEAGRLRLESTLRYRLRGTRASGLKFDLGDWNFTRLTPSELFDSPQAGPTGGLQLPFRQGVAQPSDVELTLEAQRPIEPAARRIEFDLPRPVADTIAPATVVIDIADNVELTPLLSAMTGLSPDAVVLRIPARQQSPLVFRDLGGGEPAHFAAALRIRSRQTTAAARASVRVSRRELQVEQRLEYRIAHEPQQVFPVLVPRELISAEGLTVWHNNEPLAVRPALESAEPSSADQEMEFSTAIEHSGPLAVTVRYSVPLPRWNEQSPLALSLPLIVPAPRDDFTFTGQQVDFALAEGLRIESDRIANGAGAGPLASPLSDEAISWSWPTASTATRWLVLPAAGEQAAAISLSKEWIQTWLSHGRRQERVALRLNARQDSILVHFPGAVAPESLRAALNSRAAAIQLRDAATGRVELPASERGRDCVLELWYALDAQPRRWGCSWQRLQPIRVEGAGPPARAYWQLVLPDRDYCFASPGGVESEMEWAARPWLMRRPLLIQSQLEAWIGSSRQDPLPLGRNEYLFGAVGQSPQLPLITISRGMLVLFSSGVLTVGGLLLLHVPRVRSPAWLLLAAGAVAALAVLSPDLAVLFGQFSLLGLCLVLGSVFWTRSRRGPVARAAPEHSAGLSRSRAAAVAASSVERSPPLSTATAPAGAGAELHP